MRTLDDIIPPSRRKDVETAQKSSTKEPMNPPGHSSKFPFATLGAIIFVIFASLGVLSYFSSAKIEVTPGTVSAEVRSSFTATESGGNLPYEIITAQKIATQSIKGSGTKMVNSPASGTITIYNAQAKAQKLVAKTRFATASGLIFRISSAVTVPAGTSSKPGSVAAKVYADQSGSSYNISPTSFTIPGFAGTPQAKTVYAQSSAPMMGGASGVVPVVDAVLETQTRTALATALAPDLLSSIQSQIPAGYVLLEGGSATTYQELESVQSASTGMVDIKEQGTITAIVFPSEALAKAIASSIQGIEYHNEPVALGSTDSIKLSAQNGLPMPQALSFPFTLAGTISLTYIVDPAYVAAMVVGKTRDEARVAISNYRPQIEGAIITLRPLWKQTFPQDPSSISVTVANP